MESSLVKVVVRVRPSDSTASRDAGTEFMTFPDDQTIHTSYNRNFSGEKKDAFQFDRVFYGPARQDEVYDYTARETIEDVLKGYNGTIFAYGQTGSGKSFTMFGPDVEHPFLQGIIPRACRHLFSHISNDRSGTEYSIKCSFLEVYKETINDLLNPKLQNLKVRETPSTGVWVEGLSEEFVTDEQDVMDLIKLGEKFRAVAATKMHDKSSRSHTLFILTIHQKLRDGSTKTGKLNLADLAGSEKVEKTGATGNTLEEAKKINQSLLSLGNCISALTQKKREHIPYRDSKLTFILRESLGGNTKTTLICTCSPTTYNAEETISTLRFGQRAKTISNAVQINRQRSVNELNGIIEALRKEIAALRAYILILEKYIKEHCGKQVTTINEFIALIGVPRPKQLPDWGTAPNRAALTASQTTVTLNPTNSSNSAAAGDTTPVRKVSILERMSKAVTSSSTPASPGPSPLSPRRSIAGMQEDGESMNDGNLSLSDSTMDGLGDDPISAAEAVMELEKLRSETGSQLAELLEEVTKLKDKDESASAKFAQLNEALANTEAELQRTYRERDDVKASFVALKQKHQYDSAQKELDLENKAAENKALQAANAGLVQRIELLERDVARVKVLEMSAAEEKQSFDEKSQELLRAESAGREELEEQRRKSMALKESGAQLQRQLEEVQRQNEFNMQKEQNSARRIAELEAQLQAAAAQNKQLIDEAEKSKEDFKEKEAEMQKRLTLYEEVEVIQQRRGENRLKVVASVRPTFREAVFAKKPSVRRGHMGASIKEGYLMKEGGLVRNWKRRWFVLQSDGMYYFDSDKDQKPKGTILLKDTRLATSGDEQFGKGSEGIASSRNAQYRFAIYHPSRRTFYFEADSVNNMEQWLGAIQSVIDALNGQLSRENSSGSVSHFQSSQGSPRSPEKKTSKRASGLVLAGDKHNDISQQED